MAEATGIAPTIAPVEHDFSPPGEASHQIHAEQHIAPRIESASQVQQPVLEAQQKPPADNRDSWGGLFFNKKEAPAPVNKIAAEFTAGIGVPESEEKSAPEEEIAIRVDGLPPDIHTAPVQEASVPSGNTIAPVEATPNTEPASVAEHLGRPPVPDFIMPEKPDLQASLNSVQPTSPEASTASSVAPDTTAAQSSTPVEVPVVQAQVSAEVPAVEPAQTITSPDVPSLSSQMAPGTQATPAPVSPDMPVNTPPAQSAPEVPALPVEVVQSVPAVTADQTVAPQPTVESPVSVSTAEMSMTPVSSVAEAPMQAPLNSEPLTVVQQAASVTEVSQPHAAAVQAPEVVTASVDSAPALSSNDSATAPPNNVPSEVIQPSAQSAVENLSAPEVPAATPEIPTLTPPVASEASAPVVEANTTTLAAPPPDASPFVQPTPVIEGMNTVPQLQQENQVVSQQATEAVTPVSNFIDAQDRFTQKQSDVSVAVEAPNNVVELRAPITAAETATPSVQQVGEDVATVKPEPASVIPFPGLNESTKSDAPEESTTTEVSKQEEKILLGKLLDQALPAMGLGQAMMILSGDPEAKRLADVIGDKVNELTKDGRHLTVEDIRNIPNILTMASALMARSSNPSATRDERKNSLNAANILIGLHYVQEAQQGVPTQMPSLNSNTSELSKAA